MDFRNRDPSPTGSNNSNSSIRKNRVELPDLHHESIELPDL